MRVRSELRLREAYKWWANETDLVYEVMMMNGK